MCEGIMKESTGEAFETTFGTLGKSRCLYLDFRRKASVAL